MYFHNNKSIDQNIDTNKLSTVQHIGEKKIVDINKLLNRVKINQKNEIKKKIIFFSCSTLALGLFATLIAIIR